MGRGRVERERVGGGAKQRVGFNGEVKKSHRGRWGSFTPKDDGGGGEAERRKGGMRERRSVMV